jgi:hypothetical protein
MLIGYGGSIQFTDLAPFYTGIYLETDLRRVFYTGLSDGQCIILHKKEGQARNPVQWSWDTLHLFGHMFQWHMNDHQAASIGVKFHGVAAQVMATKNFLGCTPGELLEMQTYEVEANRLSLSLFEACVRRSVCGMAEAELTVLTSDLRRYTASDIVFLTRYYNSAAGGFGTYLFSEERIFSQLITISFPSDAEIKFKKVDQICVPVIHKRSL